MSAQWYYAHNNQKHGPYTAAQLKRLAAEGQLQPTDMVHRSDMQKWTSASQVKGLFPARTDAGHTSSAPAQRAPVGTFDNLADPSALPSDSRHRPKSIGPKLALWGGLSIVLLIGIALSVIYFSRTARIGNDISSLPTTSGHDSSERMIDNTLSDPQPRPILDFSKLDYSTDFSKVNYSPVDFSKLDYTKGPQGQAIQEREGVHQKVDNDPLRFSGKAYTEHGFLNDRGDFVRNGMMTTWYVKPTGKRKGQKHEEVWWFDGKRHGRFVAWGENGNKEDEGFVVDGYLHGKRMYYYPNGSKKIEDWWIGGKQHGKYQAWHEKGQLIVEGAYKDGQQHGKWLRWNPDGTKDDEEFYIGGKLHGPLTSWFKNGRKKVESVFVDGKEEGRRVEWYDNGQKEREGIFKDGKKAGVWLFWNPDGRIRNQIAFYEGIRAENEEVYKFVKRFAELNKKKTINWSELSGNQVADILGRPQPFHRRWSKHKFVVYEIAGFKGHAKSVFSAVGEPDLVLPTLKEDMQEWVFYRGNTVIRCSVANLSALQQQRDGARVFPGDTVIMAAPGLLIGGDRDF